jgi:hypothetical protein
VSDLSLVLPLVDRDHHLEVGAGEAESVADTDSFFFHIIFCNHLLTKTIATGDPPNGTEENIREETSAGAL